MSKFKRGDVVIIKKYPELEFIAIDSYLTLSYPDFILIKLCNGQYFFEKELISQKEWEYNKDFSSMLEETLDSND